MKRIGDSEQIVVVRPYASFDRACQIADRKSRQYFEITNDGHSTRVRDWNKSECWIEVKFVSYRICGFFHEYVFLATACRCGDGVSPEKPSQDIED